MKTVMGSEVITKPAYTYNDYIIRPFLHEDIPTKEVNLTYSLTNNIMLHIPIVGSNMGHMGGRMAEKIAQLGGIGILSQDFSIKEIISRVTRVKQANPYYHMPIVLSPDDLVANALALTNKRHFDCVIIVDKNYSPLGIVTQKDLLRYAQWESLKNVMKQNMVIVSDLISTEEASLIMQEKHVHHLPVVNNEKKLVGCMTPLDITLRIHGYKPAIDSQKRLLVGVAMGMKPKESHHPIDLAKIYLEAGADILVLDIANGYLSSFVEYVKAMRQELGEQVPIMAGNVADYEGCACLLDAGCDVVKVGIGPGGACTTRRETGVGVPQAEAVKEATKACQDKKLSSSVLADGGIRTHNDLAVAILLGASSAMIGSLFAGTYESAFETEIIDGKLWKRWRGNASSSAATFRRQQIYGERYITEDLEHNEGEDGLIRVTSSVAHKIFNLIEPLKKIIAQSGCKNISDFQKLGTDILQVKSQFATYQSFSQVNFHDIYIKPQPSNVLSRKNVNIETHLTPNLKLNIPYLALHAPFVQKKICIILAQLGGMGFLNRKKSHESIDRVCQRIQKIKSYHPYYFFPSIQERREEIGKAIDFLNENAFSCVIIVKDFNNDWTPIGIATREDLYDRPRTEPLSEVIKTEICTVPEGIDLQKANDIMINRGFHHLPVVNLQGKLIGCITPRDITLRILYGLRPNVDAQGNLRVGATLFFQDNPSTILQEATILDRAGVDALLIETTDAYNKKYFSLIDQLRKEIQAPIIASGISTYEEACQIFQAGADVLKAGSKNLQIPHLQAIEACCKAAQEFNKSVISEDNNNIADPRDANISLALGCKAVGIRNVLSSTYENSIPSAQKLNQEWNSPKIIKKKIGITEYLMEDIGVEVVNYQRPENIHHSVINVIVRFINGLRSASTYSNSSCISEFQTRAILGIQSFSGYQEGKPHAFET